MAKDGHPEVPNMKSRSRSKDVVRSFWQREVTEGRAQLLRPEVRDCIFDDSDELRMCWCCERQGYQEVAHIVPHCRGGSGESDNLFLLCAECHMLSPDTVSAEWFFAWVNDTWAKHDDRRAKRWRDIGEAVKDIPVEQQKAFHASFLARIEHSRVNSIASHGAHTAQSTLDWAVAEALVHAVSEVCDDTHSKHGEAADLQGPR